MPDEPGLVIHGGARLQGRVDVGGAKNAALPIMAACLLADGPVLLRRVPQLSDTGLFRELLWHLGVHSESQDGGLRLAVADDEPCEATHESVRQMRAGVCVLGPLLARRGRATLALPGGCQIGERPLELHLNALRALGAEIGLRGGRITARAGRLRGAAVDMRGRFGTTVTGTCNVLCAATLAAGQTVIRNAAREPEVVDLGTFLKTLGARIEGLGSPEIRVEGVRSLGGGEHEIIPDRIEAATFLVAGALCRGPVVVAGARPEHLRAPIAALHEIGVGVQERPEGLVVQGGGDLHAARLHTCPYPGLPTDVQAQFMTLLCTARGFSRLCETVFPDRFGHVPELVRMGAAVRRRGCTAVIRGPVRLRGAAVTASDLRAGAALVLAGLAAEGVTLVRGHHYLDRGYERLDVKLRGLGARIERRE
jgi:UDP-N-acetylglucosamine 1-carboxyvinyltransferase